MTAGRRRLGGFFTAFAVCLLAVTVGAARADATTYYQATPGVWWTGEVWGLHLAPNG